jgi:hypothetical protein
MYHFAFVDAPPFLEPGSYTVIDGLGDTFFDMLVCKTNMVIWLYLRTDQVL